MTPVLNGTATEAPALTGAPAGGAELGTDHSTVSGSRCAAAGVAKATAASARTTRPMGIRALHLQDMVVRRECTPYNSAVAITHRVTPDHRRSRFRIAVHTADRPETARAVGLLGDSAVRHARG